MNKRQICHIEIACSDAKKTAEFYEALFGWKISHEMGDEYIFFQPEEGPGGAFSKETEVTPSRGVLFYTQVDDIQATLIKVGELGGTPVKEKTEIPGHGWYGLFAGPDGHLMGLFTPAG